MKLIEEILKEIQDAPIDDVRIGLKYTAVKIGNRIGLAHTMPDLRDTPRNVGKLLGMKLASLAHSWNLTEAAIGAAAINAQLKPKYYKKVNIFKHVLNIFKKYENIGVVGKFPFIESMKNNENNIYIFEQKPVNGCLPASAAEYHLPKCDLVIISGTTIVNKTLERLLEISNGYTMVIGPTTPLSSVLFEFGADIIAGVIANANNSHKNNLLNIISQGGGTRDFQSVVENVYMEAKSK